MQGLRRCTQRLYRDDDCGGWVLTQAEERLVINRGRGACGGQRQVMDHLAGSNAASMRL